MSSSWFCSLASDSQGYVGWQGLVPCKHTASHDLGSELEELGILETAAGRSLSYMIGKSPTRGAFWTI